MSTQMLRVIVAVVLLFHGVGHALGVLPAFGLTLGRTHAAGSWLAAGANGIGRGQAIGFALWALALVGFVSAGFAVVGWLVPQSWWSVLALVSAVVSMLALVFFWWGLPLLFPHKVGAIAANLAVFVCVLWLRLPSQLLED